MKTAVIYARYSSNSQTEQSIEGQLHVCEDYVKRNDIIIVGTYIDRAMTGTNDHRPDFQKMIKDSKSKKWDYVLVYKLDRFSRNRFEAIKYKQYLNNLGIKVISATENISDTPEGKFMESIIEGYNEFYSNELSQKVKRGMNETRMKGNFTGGQINYGYRVENHKVFINEDEAEVVRFIYEKYSLGVYVKNIVNELTKNNIKKNGKNFTESAIYKILQNEKYSGIYKLKDEVFDNIYPRIVPTELYDKVRKIIDKNKYGKRSVAVVYLLRHKLICGYCGQPISAECGTGKNGERKHYYKCLGRKHNNGCCKAIVRKELLEEFITNVIIEKLTDGNFQEQLIEHIYQSQFSKENENMLLKRLEKDRNNSQKALDNVMKAIECGIMNSTTNKRMTALEQEIDELNKQIIIEKAKNPEKLSKEEIKKYYISALKQNSEMLINYLIESIKLYDDKAEITFTSPIKKDHEDIQDFFIEEKCKSKKYVQNLHNTISFDFLVKIRA